MGLTFLPGLRYTVRMRTFSLKRVLTASLIVFALVLAARRYSPYRVLRVRGYSMGPAFTGHGLAGLRHPFGLHLVKIFTWGRDYIGNGDVIAYHALYSDRGGPWEPKAIAHRVIRTGHLRMGQAIEDAWLVKGDANPAPDKIVVIPQIVDYVFVY